MIHQKYRMGRGEKIFLWGCGACVVFVGLVAVPALLYQRKRAQAAIQASVGQTSNQAPLPSLASGAMSNPSAPPQVSGLPQELQALLPRWKEVKPIIESKARASGLTGWPAAMNWKDKSGQDPALTNGDLGSPEANDLWSNRRVLTQWEAKTKQWNAAVLMEKRDIPGRFTLILVRDLFGNPELSWSLSSRDGSSDSALMLEERSKTERPLPWLTPFGDERNPLVFYAGPPSSDNWAQFVLDSKNGISMYVDGVTKSANGDWLTDDPGDVTYGESLTLEEWRKARHIESRDEWTWFQVVDRSFSVQTNRYEKWKSNLK